MAERWYPTKWVSGLPETVCGQGSTSEHVKQVSAFVAMQVQHKTVLELGCGDLNFARHVILDWRKYTGIDLVERDTWDTYRAQGARLETWDITSPTVSLPRADVVIVRDVFIHLPNTDVGRVVERLKTLASMIIATTYSGADNAKRTSIPNARFSPIDMREWLGEPYGLTNELAPNKHLGFWKV